MARKGLGVEPPMAMMRASEWEINVPSAAPAEKRAPGRGAGRPRALTPEQVAEIRERREPLAALARRFGVDYVTAWAARSGRGCYAP